VTLPSYTIAQAVRCNLVEANVGIVTSAAHSFSVPLAANEVVTVRCRGRRYAEPKHLAYY
jgi:hypothetical protein